MCTSLKPVAVYLCRSRSVSTRLCLCWRRSMSWVNCSSDWAERSEVIRDQHLQPPYSSPIALSHSFVFLLCLQVEEKIKQTHRKYLLQEQLKIIKKVEHTSVLCGGLQQTWRSIKALDIKCTVPVCQTLQLQNVMVTTADTCSLKGTLSYAVIAGPVYWIA